MHLSRGSHSGYSRYSSNWACAKSYVPRKLHDDPPPPLALSAVVAAASATASEKEDVSGGSDEEVASGLASLPNDLLERILSLLPAVAVLRARVVCRRWRDIACSTQFLRLCSQIPPGPHPWYFMFRGKDDPSGILYDPSGRKWRSLVLPRVVDSRDWMAAASRGLVCFTNTTTYEEMYICNPVTHLWRQLPRPDTAPDTCYYGTVALSVDPETGAQTAILARSVQVPGDYSHWGLLFDVYRSADGWHRSLYAKLQDWRGGESSVICNGVLYCVTHSTTMVVPGRDGDRCRHGVLAYRIADASLSHVEAQMPCSFTCVRLIDCKGRLVMVGGIGRSDIIKGIGIWELCGREWREIARMPVKDFRSFGEVDDVFSSSGMGDLIYIHSFGSPLLMLYDMTERTWRWSQRSPLVKKYALHFFTGFCFEPQVGAAISPS